MTHPRNKLIITGHQTRYFYHVKFCQPLAPRGATTGGVCFCTWCMTVLGGSGTYMFLLHCGVNMIMSAGSWISLFPDWWQVISYPHNPGQSNWVAAPVRLPPPRGNNKHTPVFHSAKLGCSVHTVWCVHNVFVIVWCVCVRCVCVCVHARTSVAYVKARDRLRCFPLFLSILQFLFFKIDSY